MWELLGQCFVHTHTHTQRSIWALQGITEQAGVNELVITANSICHRDQSWLEASAGDVLREYILYVWRTLEGNRRSHP